MSEPRTVADVDLESLRVQVEGLDLEENRAGAGSYGVVYKVTVEGKNCIAKKLHNILLHAVKHYAGGQDDTIVRNFHKECRIMSGLKHPNVVHFVGVHYGRDRNDISLIMERLDCDLADFVKKNPNTHLCDRLHILHDVSKGLEYLHSQSPPLIHRDLTAPNVLLTEDLTAKIGDLGVSRYVDPSVVTKLTVNPGNLYYMPPESRVENPSYTTKLDIFSFGNLIIHAIIGKVPGVFDVPPNHPNFGKYAREGRVELMRRNTAVYEKMGDTHCLYSLVVRCLHDEPEQRPAVGEVRSSLRELYVKHPRMTLLEACKTGNVGVIKELLEGGADPNQTDKENRTTLNWACMKNTDSDVVRALIEAGANVNTPDESGRTPLRSASFFGNQICVEQLIEAGAKVDVPKEDGATALIAAAQNGHLKVVELLIASKAQINHQTNAGVTALQMACSNGHDEVVRVLLAAKATVNTQSKSGRAPLWSASFEGHQKCVEQLIEAGANVDVPNEDGATALVVAAQNGHLKVVELLIASKAQINHQQNDGVTALYVACQNGHDEVVRVLLAAKATVNTQHKDGFTALIVAAHNGHLKVVELLIASKAQINRQQNNGFTALHHACQNGHLKVVEILIIAHASVNAQSKFNVTPLMSAANKGHDSIVELLLSKGADPELKNNARKTAYDLARENGHNQVCQQLPPSYCSVM